MPGSSNQGPYQVTFSSPGFKNIELMVEADGCMSDVSSQLIEVVAPLLAPVISCVTGTSEITFNWSQIPNATDYILSLVDTLPGITLTHNGDFELVATGLNPLDELTLIIEVLDNTSPCPSTIINETCEAQDCPPIDIQIDAIPQICLDEGEIGTQINLNDYLQITGDNGNPSIKWSGNSVINPTGIFEPNASNLGAQQVLVEVNENGCDFSKSLIINVLENPKSEFTVESPICILDKSEVALVEIPTPGTTFFWNFGNANNQMGINSEGPHNLAWSTAMTDQISLYTERDNCQSELTVMDIVIDVELTAPTIQCTAGTDNILFEWVAVAGVTNYQVIVDDAPMGFTTDRVSNFSFLVENLVPSDEVTITVTAENDMSACPSVSSTQTCSASPCPSIDFSFQAIPDICLEPNLVSIDLNDFVTITSDLMNGLIEWSGTGTTTDGIFDPMTANIGQHTIELSFKELNCEKTETINININPLPIADAGVDVEINCLENIVALGGNGNSGNPTGVEYTWSGGTVQNLNNSQTQTEVPGNYVLTAINMLTGCTSTDEVMVLQGALSPVLSTSEIEISCYGFNDGRIILEDVAEGTPPFQFSLNGSPFETISEYENLSPGDYLVKVIDAEGCEEETVINIQEPLELMIDLSILADSDPVIFGDSISLGFNSNYNLDLLNSIQWFAPDLIADCLSPNLEGCIDLSIVPTQNTTYQLRVETENGCFATSEESVNVIKDYNIFIPTAFSPNDDGINDVLKIFANSERLKNIKTFQIYDRWGESVYQKSNFLPSDNHGWNGRLRGKRMKAAVFGYFAEIEFIDGTIEIFKGDVTLFR